MSEQVERERALVHDLLDEESTASLYFAVVDAITEELLVGPKGPGRLAANVAARLEVSRLLARAVVDLMVLQGCVERCGRTMRLREEVRAEIETLEAIDAIEAAGGPGLEGWVAGHVLPVHPDGRWGG